MAHAQHKKTQYELSVEYGEKIFAIRKKANQFMTNVQTASNDWQEGCNYKELECVGLREECAIMAAALSIMESEQNKLAAEALRQVRILKKAREVV